MKVELLRLNTANKPSPMSEGVTEIWINNQPCKDLNLTTRHTQARRAPRVATIHDVTKKSGRVLPRPSAIFHAYASVDTPWVARTLSHYTFMKWGEVRYRPTHRHTNQMSLGIPYVPYALVQFKCMFIRAQPTRALIDIGGGYHLGAPNIRSDHSPSFPSSILHFPLIAPPGLQLCHSINYSSSQHSNLEPRYKSHKSQEWSLPLDFYRSSIH
jgi:hypothetical protein